jgi:hypothetical protein
VQSQSGLDQAAEAGGVAKCEPSKVQLREPTPTTELFVHCLPQLHDRGQIEFALDSEYATGLVHPQRVHVEDDGSRRLGSS